MKLKFLLTNNRLASFIKTEVTLTYINKIIQSFRSTQKLRCLSSSSGVLRIYAKQVNLFVGGLQLNCFWLEVFCLFFFFFLFLFQIAFMKSVFPCTKKTQVHFGEIHVSHYDKCLRYRLASLSL